MVSCIILLEVLEASMRTGVRFPPKPRCRPGARATQGADAIARGAHGWGRPAQITLRSADGESDMVIAEQVGASMPLMGRWRRCFSAHGVTG